MLLYQMCSPFAFHRAQVVRPVSAQRDDERIGNEEENGIRQLGTAGDSTGQIVLYCVTDRAFYEAAEEQGCLDSERMTIL